MNKDIMKDVVKFSRLLYRNAYCYVIEFEVNGELKLWYNFDDYQGWKKPIDFKEELSDCCILQNKLNLSWLFENSPITHFDIDLPNVKNVSYMFDRCKNLIYFNSKMTNVENAEYMFSNCKNLVYFKSKIPNVKDTYNMFYGCSEEFFQNHPHLRDL